MRSIGVLDFETWKILQGPRGRLHPQRKELVFKEKTGKKRRNQKAKCPSLRSHRKAVSHSAPVELRKPRSCVSLISIW